MPERSKVVFRASVRGAGTVGRRLTALSRELQDIIADEMRDLGDEAETILKGHAPVGVTGRLQEGITSIPKFGHARVAVEVRSLGADERTGYNYTRVSRFGHRRQTIHPRKHRALAIDWLKDWSHVDWVNFVSASHPASDWVADARPELDAEADRAMGRIERAVDTRLLR